MTYLLDTNIVSAYLRRRATLAHRMLQHSGHLALPTMALAELYHWAYARPDPAPMLDAIRELCTLIDVLDFNAASAEMFGKLRVDLSRRGVSVAPQDLIIASIALVHGLTLVTHNTAHFASIPGLVLKDWLTP